VLVLPDSPGSRGRSPHRSGMNQSGHMPAIPKGGTDMSKNAGGRKAPGREPAPLKCRHPLLLIYDKQGRVVKLNLKKRAGMKPESPRTPHAGRLKDFGSIGR